MLESERRLGEVELDSLDLTRGVFLDMPKAVRLQRLTNRKRKQFGARIEARGELEQEHRSFME